LQNQYLKQALFVRWTLPVPAEEAKKVAVVGDFLNNWSPKASAN